MRAMGNSVMTNYSGKEAQEKATIQRMRAYQKKMEAMVKRKPKRYMHRKG